MIWRFHNTEDIVDSVSVFRLIVVKTGNSFVNQTLFISVMQLRVIALILLLSLTDGLLCSEKGYTAYLKEYPFKEGLSEDYVKFFVL